MKNLDPCCTPWIHQSAATWKVVTMHNHREPTSTNTKSCTLHIYRLIQKSESMMCLCFKIILVIHCFFHENHTLYMYQYKHGCEFKDFVQCVCVIREIQRLYSSSINIALNWQPIPFLLWTLLSESLHTLYILYAYILSWSRSLHPLCLSHQIINFSTHHQAN